MNEIATVTGVAGEPDKATKIEIFRRMALIKRCDEKMRTAIMSGKIIAPFYPVRGQEAVSAAMAVNMNEDDYYVTIYRGLHDHLAKGVPLKDLWAEYAGKVTGSCKGKGGPMHITHPASGVMVTTGIVGSGIPIANGLAWASLIKQDGRITVTSFGDGASNIGAFHEALNMASCFNLPVIFLCQNNLFAEHTAYAKCTSVESVVDRASSYSMPGIKVDGNDPVAMWKAAKEAVDRARAGGGPTLIEAMTFRFFGHNFGDPGHYIPKELYDEQVEKDCYPNYRKRLIAEGEATEEELAGIEARIEADIDEAAAFALASDYPDEAELAIDVLDEEIVL